jgi:hypothetical protein
MSSYDVYLVGEDSLCKYADVKIDLNGTVREAKLAALSSFGMTSHSLGLYWIEDSKGNELPDNDPMGKYGSSSHYELNRVIPD